MADDSAPDPVPEAGRRATVAAALVLAFAALTGELRAPAPVLPVVVALGLVALAATGLAALVARTGVPALVTGRELRTAAIVPIALITFLVVGPRFRLVVAMLTILAGLLALAVAMAAIAAIPTRRRDSVTAVVALAVVAVAGWFGAPLVREGRLAIHADRYRSEAEARIGRPVTEVVEYPGTALDQPFFTSREPDALAGDEEGRDPIAVAWLWDPGEDGPASSWGVLYAPEGGPPVHGLAAGVALRCREAAVDDFYWCSFV